MEVETQGDAQRRYLTPRCVRMGRLTGKRDNRLEMRGTREYRAGRRGQHATEPQSLGTSPALPLGGGAVRVSVFTKGVLQSCGSMGRCLQEEQREKHLEKQSRKRGILAFSVSRNGGETELGNTSQELSK